MIKTLQVSVPVSGKPAYAGIVASMTHCGMHVYRSCVTERNRGMLVTVVTNCAGDLNATLKELSAILPHGNSIEVQDDVALFH
jgi:hypothetical protein